MWTKLLDLAVKLFDWFRNSSNRAKRDYQELRRKAELRRAKRIQEAKIENSNIIDDINASMFDKINKAR